jgi:general stress protein 26
MSVTVHHNNHATALEFLKQHRVGALATVGPDNQPYVAAIYYIIDSKLNAHFVTKTQTKKATNLEHHDHAMLLVYGESNQTTVQLAGTVHKILDTAEVSRLYSKIIELSVDNHGLSIPPQAKIQAGDYAAYRLEPTSVRMATFQHAKVGDKYQDIFKTIELKHHESHPPN